jgi:hypothetical protein
VTAHLANVDPVVDLREQQHVASLIDEESVVGI